MADETQILFPDPKACPPKLPLVGRSFVVYGVSPVEDSTVNEPNSTTKSKQLKCGHIGAVLKIGNRPVGGGAPLAHVLRPVEGQVFQACYLGHWAAHFTVKVQASTTYTLEIWGEKQSDKPLQTVSFTTPRGPMKPKDGGLEIQCDSPNSGDHVKGSFTAYGTTDPGEPVYGYIYAGGNPNNAVCPGTGTGDAPDWSVSFNVSTVTPGNYTMRLMDSDSPPDITDVEIVIDAP